ncbi:hypothetical protein STXM2123_5120 [Streptomyces sp. F-3]|nr:hypothetical protein STXM2123_5120 [Streptomyces sp. F-3]
MSALPEHGHDLGSDEPGTAGDQYAHVITLVAMRRIQRFQQVLPCP